MIGNENTIFLVVLNDEEQYSIWPEFKQIPEGWRAEGKKGVKSECVEYIEETWSDMRASLVARK